MNEYTYPLPLTGLELLLLRQRLSDGPGLAAVNSELDAKLYAAQVILQTREQQPELYAGLPTDQCPCGRMDKPAALWLCRCCYLEKEIHYAVTELERGGDRPAAGMRRLHKLEDSRGR